MEIHICSESDRNLIFYYYNWIITKYHKLFIVIEQFLSVRDFDYRIY